MHFSKEAGSLSTTSEVPRHLGDAYLRGVTAERRHCTFYWKPVSRHFIVLYLWLHVCLRTV